ncbi:hypothetical protein LCGC14_3012170 [marine sediment metagenome]|uniref:Uncharacterized protein n=1 Tax=marine sediment metagenome TaxID=412755 RepID=A0A0F8WXS0_9ZZZZ
MTNANIFIINATTKIVSYVVAGLPIVLYAEKVKLDWPMCALGQLPMNDIDRLVKFMREEAANATDERESWFTATGDALERESCNGNALRENGIMRGALEEIVKKARKALTLVLDRQTQD